MTVSAYSQDGPLRDDQVRAKALRMRIDAEQIDAE